MAEWHRCDAVLAFHHDTRSWWYGGETSRPIPALFPAEARPFSTHTLRTERTREEFTTSVERALEYIRAGDVYQVNLTHPLTATFDGSARALFLRMLRAGRPRLGFYAESDDFGTRRCLVGASPELFLHLDAASGRMVTRPMKGTGRAMQGDKLLASVKEQAELAMIVDLMRNDLGRVCRPGTMRVVQPREIERHGEGEALLLQATGTIEGYVREGVTRADVLRAAFPGGSISGAPKVRALQIISELEPWNRGPYCGACGFLDDSGSAELAMTIRTAAIHGQQGEGFDGIGAGQLVYGVGAGIVSDSEPAAEWRETIHKAAVLEQATGFTVLERST
jgi:anthranilate/para-aminobenzoate synthase component I